MMQSELINQTNINKELAILPELFPAFPETESRSSYNKVPLSNISALGVGFEPITAAIQQVISGGKATSGIYRVTIPNGGTLASFKDGSGYLGSVLTEAGTVGGGQARLNPLVCDPTMLFMAAALMNIEKKLDVINETQQEMLEFLKEKEKAKLRGNLLFLSDVINNYKYNWNSTQYKANGHIKVLDIRQDSEQSILLSRALIESRMDKKQLLYSKQDVEKRVDAFRSEFSDYQLAIYLYAMSSLAEVLLLDNFDSAFINSVVQKINSYAIDYRELYSKCYSSLESIAKKSIQTLVKSGIASASRGAGEVIEKIPVISKTQIDENLIAAGKNLERKTLDEKSDTLALLLSKQSSNVTPFIENLKTIEKVFNKPLKMFFDEDSIYIPSA